MRGNRYESLDNGAQKKKTSPLLSYFQQPQQGSSSSNPPSSSSRRYNQVGGGGGRGSSSSNNPFDDDYVDNDVPRSSNPFGAADDDEEEVVVPLSNAQQKKPLPPVPPPPPPAPTRPPAISPVHAQSPPLAAQHPPPPGPPPSARSSSGGVEMTAIAIQRQQERIDRDKQRSEQSRNQLKKHLHKIEKHVEKNSTTSSTGHPMALTGEDENAVIRFLVAKRVFGYPGTNGTISSNYRQYVYNNHPLLSLFLLHPLNPYGRKERFIVFMNSLFFAIFISFVVLETTYIPKIATCRLGCNRELVVTNSSVNSLSFGLDILSNTNSSQTITTDECVGGYNDGLEYSKYHEICSRYEPWMLSAICGAFIVVYQSFMEFCATCGCMQGQRIFENNCLGNRCKCIVEWCGGTILTFFTFVSVVLLIWALIACYILNADYSLFSGILLSKVWSAGEWFIWSAPYFSYRYPIDRRRFLKKMQKKYGSPPPTSPNDAEAPPPSETLTVNGGQQRV